MTIQKSKHTTFKQHAVRKRHSLGPKENYLTEIDVMLDRVDQAIQEIVVQIVDQDDLNSDSTTKMNRLKYFKERLVYLRTVTKGSDKLQLEAVKAEAGLLFERVNDHLNL